MYRNIKSIFVSKYLSGNVNVHKIHQQETAFLRLERFSSAICALPVGLISREVCQSGPVHGITARLGAAFKCCVLHRHNR